MVTIHTLDQTAVLIDYILASREVFDSILDFCVESRTESSHLPIWVKLPLKSKIRTERILHVAGSANCPLLYYRSPHDIEIFIDNVKSSFTSNFLSSIIKQIEDLTVDVNEIISNIVDKLKCAAIPKKRRNISKTNRYGLIGNAKT